MTAKRLSEVYCIPQTAKDCKALNVSNGEIGMKLCQSLVSDGKAIFQGNSGRTEIPVQHFIDLAEDRIVPWRLEEVGFKYIKDHTPFYEFSISKVSNLSWAESTSKHGIALEIREEQIWFSIHNFTDLLTLIKFMK